MSSPAAAAAREDRRRGVVVDLVSPPGRRHAKLSFGSCISETPSPSPDAAAGASAGTCGHAAAGPAAAAEALSPARREACVCVITGLPAGDSRLAHKLQSCAQVTVSTLRAALHNALGRPLGSVCGETREALIREYCATLSSAPLAGADAAREAQAAARLDIEVVEHAPPEPPGECPARTGGHRAVGHSGTRPQSPRCEDSESDIDDLTSSPHRPARCTRSPRKPAASRVSSLWERTEATLRRSADGHDAGHGPADSAGEAAAGACIAGARGPVRPTSREPEARAGEVMPDGEERAGGHDSGPDDLGLWRRLERRRERDLELRAAEKAESHLPLWARLEARQQRAGASGKQSAGPQAPHLQQDTDDDNDDDIFAVRGGALSSGAGGAQGRGGHQTAGTGAAGAAQRAEVVGAGSDSDESIADLTCAETRVEDLRDQMAREVARLERERDEKVRKETAAAVAALDFEGAALLKRSIHADFQRKISAAQRKISAATGMCQQRARGEAGDRSGRQAAPAAAQVLSSKNSPKNKGGSAAAAGGAQGVPGRIFRNRSTHGGDVSAVRVGSAASGDMPKYREMSVPDLKKAMSRYPCVCARVRAQPGCVRCVCVCVCARARDTRKLAVVRVGVACVHILLLCGVVLLGVCLSFDMRVRTGTG